MTTNSSPKLTDLLRQHTQRLKAAGDTTARLDVLVIIEDVLSIDRTEILAGSDIEPRLSELREIERRINRRINHEPLAYIRGRANFFGREFAVNHHTLVPRPETETMIEIIKTINLTKTATIADVGCGCGCIGLTLALELNGCQVDLVDIDKECLRLAKTNAKALGVNVHFLRQDLLGKNHQHYELIAANLPYVPDNHTINKAAMQEPKHAIFGGKDGLDIYRRMFGIISGSDTKPAYVITECLPPQHRRLTTIAKNAGFRLKSSEDFIQLFEKI
jgi:release factor glutamine methyltransferase